MWMCYLQIVIIIIIIIIIIKLLEEWLERWTCNIIHPFEFFSLSPPRLAFLAWSDFHARSPLARSTIPEGK